MTAALARKEDTKNAGKLLVVSNYYRRRKALVMLVANEKRNIL